MLPERVATNPRESSYRQTMKEPRGSHDEIRPHACPTQIFVARSLARDLSALISIAKAHHIAHYAPNLKETFVLPTYPAK
jgi:hypothetical protein